jgi:hypothetical protein
MLCVDQAAAQRADFNGDFYSDVAVGVLEDVGGLLDAGTVHVFYGSVGGISSVNDVIWHQNSGGPILDVAEANDWFGTALVAGDFNGDDYYDLAIGVPLEDVGAIVDAGAVNVLYGSAAGLVAFGNQFWHQNSAGIFDAVEANDHFGHSLASGDFNGDGYDDLAIGVPLEDIGAIADAGAVNVIYGSAAGLVNGGNQFWHQNSAGPILDISENGDNFGFSLAACDFNGNGNTDLAIGVYLEDVVLSDEGAVNVIYGSAAGLTAAGNQFWHQDVGAIIDTAQVGDSLGFALTVGNFNGDMIGGEQDPLCDLAIGVPGEDIYDKDSVLIENAGAVQVLYGSMGVGLTDASNQFWYQDFATILDTIETDDQFGSSLVTGDFNDDSADDLVVGVWYEDLGFDAQGAVNVIYGVLGGVLTDLGNQFWNQDSPGIAGTGAASDLFGYALATGRFNNDFYGDLVVTVPYEQVGAAPAAGAMNVLYGSIVVGLDDPGNQRWHQNSAGIAGVANANDNFGIAASFSSLSAMASLIAPGSQSQATEGEDADDSGSTEHGGNVSPNGELLITNYPNPFNPSTTVHYAIPEADHVTIEVYNVLGQRILTLVDEFKNAGYHSVDWNGRDATGEQVSSGVYFYKVQTGGLVHVQKMMVAK